MNWDPMPASLMSVRTRENRCSSSSPKDGNYHTVITQEDITAGLAPRELGGRGEKEDEEEEKAKLCLVEDLSLLILGRNLGEREGGKKGGRGEGPVAGSGPGMLSSP